MRREWKRAAGIVMAVTLGAATAGCAMGEDEEAALGEIEGQGGIEVSGAMDPIIWVHGCTPPDATDEQASHFTDAQMAYFAAQGYPSDYLYRFVNQGPQCTSNIDFAAQLRDLVAEVRAITGRPRVDIVAHSMGALATRLYLHQGGTRCVRAFVSIAGGNHGSGFAQVGLGWQDMFGGYPAFEGVQEMFPPYACAGQTYGGSADIQATVNGCLTPWGRTVYVDETPQGGTHYLSIRNSLDEIAVPVDTACLDQDFIGDCSSSVNTQVTVPPGPGPCGPQGCPGHITMLWDPGVIGMVYDFVTPGDFDSALESSGRGDSSFCD